MFRLGPQPDIVRSFQKDESFHSLVRSQTKELANNVLGSRSAHYEAEIDLIAAAAYHAIQATTGKPTLGQEYCDLLPTNIRFAQTQHSTQNSSVKSNAFNGHTNSQNFNSAAPSKSSFSSQATATASLSLAPTPAAPTAATSAGGLVPLPPPSPNSALATKSFALSTQPTSLLPPRPIVSPLSARSRAALFSLQVLLPYVAQKLKKAALRHSHDTEEESSAAFSSSGYSLRSSASSSSSSALTSASSSSVSSVLLSVRHWLIRWCHRSILFVTQSDLLQYVSRFHLALFYLSGEYYDICHRILSIRFVLFRHSEIDPPNYSLFGMMILIECAVTAIRKLKDIWNEWKENRQNRRRIEEEMKTLDTDQPANSFGPGTSAAHSTASTSLPASSSSADFDEDGALCSLCLSRRKDTTVTECGHLYCWSCISESVSSKPECPLCRQPAALQSLILLANYE